MLRAMLLLAMSAREAVAMASSRSRIVAALEKVAAESGADCGAAEKTRPPRTAIVLGAEAEGELLSNNAGDNEAEMPCESDGDDVDDAKAKAPCERKGVCVEDIDGDGTLP